MARLRETIRLNGLDARVTVVEAALAAAGGERRMSAAGGSQERRLLPPGDAGRDVVTATTLEALLDRFFPGGVDLLKLDVEGAEEEVLAAASRETLRRCREVAVEYHGVAARDVLFDRLAAAGFVVHRHRPAGPTVGVAQARRD